MIRLTVTSASVPTPRSVVCAQFYRNKTSQVYILPPLLALLSVWYALRACVNATSNVYDDAYYPGRSTYETK